MRILIDAEEMKEQEAAAEVCHGSLQERELLARCDAALCQVFIAAEDMLAQRGCVFGNSLRVVKARIASQAGAIRIRRD